MTRLLLALLASIPLAACAVVPGASSDPVDGVAYVFSAGERVVAGHNHADLLQRSAGCPGCWASAVNAADVAAQQRAAQAGNEVLDRFLRPGLAALDQRLQKLEAAVAALSTSSTGGDR